MRLLCSGACRVLGLWATSLCLVPELPCLWPPGIFPTFPFTWSLPVLRSCRTPSGSSPSCCDNLLCHERCLSTLTSWLLGWNFRETGKGGHSVSSSVSSSWSTPERMEWISLSSGLISDRERFTLAGTPPMHPRVRFVSCLPLDLLSGYPSLAFCNHPWQGDLSRSQSVPADHKWPLIFL